MLSWGQLAGQIVFYSAVCLGIGTFAAWPRINTIPPGTAQIKMSLTHGGARIVDCRRLTPQEIAKLPPSERRPNTCGRERQPVHVQLWVDGKALFDETIEPLGLLKDGPSRVYRTFVVPAGEHVIVGRLNERAGPGKIHSDNAGSGGDSNEFQFVTEKIVTLKPDQSLAIDFKADQGGFIFH